MSASRSGTRATSRSIPTPPAEAISPAEEVSPAAPRSCSETSSPFSEQLQAALEHLRLLEGVADLHRRPLRLVALAELGRGQHRGAADPVAPGRGAHQDDRVADPGGGGADHLVLLGDPDAHRVDQAVVLVGRLEVDLAADRRRRRSSCRSGRSRAPRRRAGGASAPSRARRSAAVEDRDRPRAEREDVAEDPADPGRRALEGLDRARVVVGLDLEGDRVAVADVDRAGVLARPHHHPLALGRQPPQQLARVLVGAVLGPEQAEHRQLDVVRLAPELLDDQLELGVGQAELAVLGERSTRHAGAPAQRARRPAARRSTRQRVDRVLGMGHQADHVAGLVAHPGDVPRRAVRVLPRRVAVGDLAVRLERVEHLLRRPVAPFAVLGRDREPLAAVEARLAGRVVLLSPSGVTTDRSATLTARPAAIRSTWRQTKRMLSLSSSAPGSRPASQRTWKPLQIPSTGPPPAANSATASIAGEKRAIAPARR